MAARSETETANRRSPRPGLTVQGWVTLAGGVSWSIVAWLTGQRDLLWPGLFLLALPVSGWLLLAVTAGRPQLRRQLYPTEVTVGEQAHSVLDLKARTNVLGSIANYVDTRSAGLHGPGTTFATAGFGWQHRIEQRVVPSWRGRHRLGPLRRDVRDALGLARTRHLLGGTDELLALPLVHELDPLRRASGLGSTLESAVPKSSLIGQDDVLVREYLPGDDVRRIHWRSTARVGELMVRREERAWDPGATLLLDNRSSSFGSTIPEPRFEWLVSLAASIGSHLLNHGFALSLCDAQTPADGQATATASLLRRLALVRLHRTPSLATALAGSHSGGRGQLLIALLGRLDDADASLLAGARGQYRACWAVLPEPTVTGKGALALLEAAGWRYVVVPPGASVAEAWRAIGDAA